MNKGKEKDGAQAGLAAYGRGQAVSLFGLCGSAVLNIVGDCHDFASKTASLLEDAVALERWFASRDYFGGVLLDVGGLDEGGLDEGGLPGAAPECIPCCCCCCNMASSFFF